MIRNITELEDSMVLHAEVGSVGAGFAGIDLARYLGRHGVQVVLLESGGLEFDADVQALARIESVGMRIRIPDLDGGFTPYLAPIYRGETRLRQFGGTSNIWTGKVENLRFPGLRGTALGSLQRLADQHRGTAALLC